MTAPWQGKEKKGTRYLSQAALNGNNTLHKRETKGSEAVQSLKKSAKRGGDRDKLAYWEVAK